MLKKKFHRKKNSTIISVEIAFDQEDYEQVRQQVLKKNAKNIRLPGFRKGKAPKDLIEKKFGHLLDSETEEAMIEKAMSAIIEDQDLPPVYSVPRIIDKQKKGNRLTKLLFEYETKPEVKLTKYKKIHRKRPNFHIEDKDIEPKRKFLKQIYGKLKPKDSAFEEGDIVQLLIIPEDRPKYDSGPIYPYTDESQIRRGVYNDLYQALLDAGLRGKRKGDTVDFQWKAQDNIHNFHATITEIYSIESISDEELAKIILKKEDSQELIQSLKAEIREKIENYFRDRLSKEILEEIIRKSDFLFTATYMIEDIIERERKNILRSLKLEDGTWDDIAKYYHKSPKQMQEEIKNYAMADWKKHLVIEKIIEKENIPISEKEIELTIEFIKSLSDKNNTAKRSPDYYREWAEDILKEQKVVDYIWTNQISISKEVKPIDELLDLIEKKE